MRLAGISTIEEANEFLNSYIKEFNDKFSLTINSTKTVFDKQPDKEIIIRILAERKIDTGHCIKFENKFYIQSLKTINIYI